MASLISKQVSSTITLTFQWDIRFTHARYLFFCLRNVCVAPATQVEAKSEERLPSRQTNELTILLNDGPWCGSGEEVKIEGAPDDAVLDE